MPVSIALLFWTTFQPRWSPRPSPLPPTTPPDFIGQDLQGYPEELDDLIRDTAQTGVVRWAWPAVASVPVGCDEGCIFIACSFSVVYQVTLGTAEATATL